MIDQRINDSLKELERSLSDIQSAKRQVERTVNSYGEVSSAISDYVDRLGALVTNAQKLIDSIGNDYQKKSALFEKDRTAVIENTNAAIDELSKAVSVYKASLDTIQKRLSYSLICSTVTIVGLAAVLFLVLK